MKMSKIARFFGALLFLVLLVCGCRVRTGGGTENSSQNSAAVPCVEITDAAGRRVRMKQPSERIVLLRGRDIFALALFGDMAIDRIVAWGGDLQTCDKNGYEKFLERFPHLKTIPQMGVMLDGEISAEAVLAMAPDLVIADKHMALRQPQIMKTMEEAGVPLFFLEIAKDPVESPILTTRLLGEILGQQDHTFFCSITMRRSWFGNWMQRGGFFTADPWNCAWGRQLRIFCDLDRK